MCFAILLEDHGNEHVVGVKVPHVVGGEGLVFVVDFAGIDDANMGKGADL